MYYFPLPKSHFQDDRIDWNKFDNEILDLKISNDGLLYVLTKVTIIYKGQNTPDNVHSNVMYIFSNDNTLVDVVFLDKLLKEVKYGEGDNYVHDNIAHFSIAPDSEIFILTEKNRAFIFNKELNELIIKFSFVEPNFPENPRPIEDTYKLNLVSNAVKGENNQYFCVLREKTKHAAFFDFSMIVTSTNFDCAVKGIKPTLKLLNRFNEHSTTEQNDFTVFDVNFSSQPQLSLIEQCEKKFDQFYYEGFFGTPVPLMNGQVIIPLFENYGRGGNKGKTFVFAIVNDKGDVIGRLEDIDGWNETPHSYQHLNVHFDKKNKLIFYKNHHAFNIFDTEGILLKKIFLENDEIKFLQKFKTVGITDEGELFFYHPKQLAMIKCAAFDNIENSSDNLSRLVQKYKAEMKISRKERKPLKYAWTIDDSEVRVI